MIPVIDLHSSDAQQEAQKAADGLSTYGALFVKVPQSDNLDTFTDMMEDYFDQPVEQLRQDERPEHSYQVGCTVGIEKAKCFSVGFSCLSKNLEAQITPDTRRILLISH